jgi:antitoxin component YwqK of YwqJK toxin-antitoxin module
MDANWLDREYVVRHVTAVHFGNLTYDEAFGQYRLGEKPFTGASLRRWPNGALRGVTHFRNGLEHGVAVAWYYGGQVAGYNEMEEGVCNGWHIEWNEDGTIRKEFRCVRGRPIKEQDEGPGG